MPDGGILCDLTPYSSLDFVCTFYDFGKKPVRSFRGEIIAQTTKEIKTNQIRGKLQTKFKVEPTSNS